VRALYLDRHHPMVSNLFDVKENLATIALPLALALGALCGQSLGRLRTAGTARCFAAMSALRRRWWWWFDVLSRGATSPPYKAV
jgi:hypothetical protein